MSTHAGQRTPARRVRPRSPMEDGEIGESAQDVLMRHPLLSPGERRIVKALRAHEEELTPCVAASVGRLLSAALSPMAMKADVSDAKEALEIIATEVLPKRKQQRRKLAHAEERVLRQQEREVAAAIEAENVARGTARAAARPTVGSPRRIRRCGYDNYGNLVRA